MSVLFGRKAYRAYRAFRKALGWSSFRQAVSRYKGSNGKAFWGLIFGVGCLGITG